MAASCVCFSEKIQANEAKCNYIPKQKRKVDVASRFFISSSFDPAVIPQIDLSQAETSLGMGLLTHTDVVRGGKQAVEAVEAQISCQKMCAHEAPGERCVVVSLENAEAALWFKTTVTTSGRNFCSPDCVRSLILGSRWEVE